MSEKVTIKAERRELHLPAIALRGLVVFPNNLVHFEVGREKSIAAVEWAMANNSNVFLVAQKEMELSDPTQEDLFAYGVVAEVKQVLRVSDDLVKVLVEGKYRAKLTDLDTTGDFLLASADTLSPCVRGRISNCRTCGRDGRRPSRRCGRTRPAWPGTE